MKKRISQLADIRNLFREFRFHDDEIIRLSCANSRAVIEITDYALVFTDVTYMKHCALPAIWLEEELVNDSDNLRVNIKTHKGEVLINFHDFRFIHKADYKIIVPPIDI